MFRSLFRKKRRPSASSLEDETLHSARAGDVFTISGLSLEYDDAYFLIEKRNRYESEAGDWQEVLGVEGDTKLWVDWAGSGGQTVAVRQDGRPMGLDQAGIPEDLLVTMDEEHSIDNTLTFEEATYDYENSGEAFYFEGGLGEGVGFYMWEFASDEASKLLSVVKWEGSPFQVYVSDVMPFDSISVYKR